MSSRRAAMTLFSAPTEPASHRARIVLAEKGLEAEIIDVLPGRYPEDLLDLNPYHTVPTFVDRDLVLYDVRVITEYLDERFPHPPLMPIDPVARAQFRLAILRFERDWYSIASALDAGPGAAAAVPLRKQLREAVLASTDLFRIKPWFLSDEFSLIDATIAPILWRLPSWGIELPKEAQPLLRYASAVFARPSFRASLSASEFDREVLS